jgi:hypothetical protein
MDQKAEDTYDNTYDLDHKAGSNNNSKFEDDEE